MVKGKKRHIPAILCHPHWRAAVPGITKDIKLPRLLKIGEIFSPALTTCLDTHRGLKGWLGILCRTKPKELQHSRNLRAARTGDYWHKPQTKFCLENFHPSQIELQPLVFVQTSIHAIKTSKPLTRETKKLQQRCSAHRKQGDQQALLERDKGKSVGICCHTFFF